MDRLEIGMLVERIEKVYRRQIRDVSTLGGIANEWLGVFAFAPAKRVNEALSIYIRENKTAPTPAHILTIYKELERQADKGAVLSESRCPLCGGGKYALAEISGMYHGLGLPCPCRRPGELLALQNGRKVMRKVGKRGGDGRVRYVGEVELWMRDERLYGEIKRGFGLDSGKVDEAPKPDAEKPQSRQSRLFSPEEWAAEMGSSELPF